MKRAFAVAVLSMLLVSALTGMLPADSSTAKAKSNSTTFPNPQYFSNRDFQVAVRLNPTTLVYGSSAAVSFDVTVYHDLMINQFTVGLNGNIIFSDAAGNWGNAWNSTWSNMTMYSHVDGSQASYYVVNIFNVKLADEERSLTNVGYVNGSIFANYSVNGENRTFSRKFGITQFCGPNPSPSPSPTPTQPSEPFPIALAIAMVVLVVIATIALIVVICAGLLVYFKKRKRYSKE